MKKLCLPLLFACLLIIPAATASAQDFGIMESAETINQGNFSAAALLVSLAGAVMLLAIVSLVRARAWR